MPEAAGENTNMKWFQNLSTMTKLMGAFSVVCAVLLVVGVVGISGLGSMDSAMNILANRHMKGIAGILGAETEMLRVGKAVRQAILLSDPSAQRKQGQIVDEAFKQMQADLDECEKTLVSAEAKAKMKTVRDLYPDWAADNQKAYELALAGRSNEAFGLVTSAAEQANKMSDAAAEIRASKLQLAQTASEESTQLYNRLRTAMVLMVGIGVVFALALGVFISRAIASPLNQAAGVLGDVAQGDFTRQLDVDTKDEIGRLASSLNTAVTSMREALQSVSESASAVTTASSELSSASQSISAGAQEQASSLEETAASLEEMTSAVKQNADNAQQAAQLAQGARDVAEKGGRVVGQAVTAMEEINASSRKIADIITAIDEIAFQTNLLALNAAVEAARAGEQGRGFAVVAGEVRNLAQRSASAAKEIKGLIHDSVEKVESGTKLVNQSGTTLEEIVQSVKRVTDIVGEIAASSREQSAGIEQVNTAVTQMDAVTQANASQTEELAGTADGLSHQAQGMMELVGRFKLGENGAGGPKSYSAPVSKPKAKVVPMRKAGVHASARKAAPRVTAPVAAPAATGTEGGFEEF
jgi:methyl-accepting chemotaxis protein